MLLLTALLLAVTAPGQASAATLELEVGPRQGVALGQAHDLGGRLVRGGEPLGGQTVVIEARRFPYRGPFEAVRTLVTDRGGRFAVRRRFDRNHQVRAVAPELALVSHRVTALTFPRTRVRARARRDTVELVQSYATPRDVRLTGPTLFYLGPARARTAPLRARARIRRIGAGRFEARATLTVPEAYRGRFRYASCFPYDPRAGLGDPQARCPRRTYRF